MMLLRSAAARHGRRLRVKMRGPGQQRMLGIFHYEDVTRFWRRNADIARDMICPFAASRRAATFGRQNAVVKISRFGRR